MLAAAIAHVSGLKLLVLDRIDVLDIHGRSDLMGWLTDLAHASEIETALIFGTLKSLPAQGVLPPEFAAHWIEDGEIQQLRKAA